MILARTHQWFLRTVTTLLLVVVAGSGMVALMPSNAWAATSSGVQQADSANSTSKSAAAEQNAPKFGCFDRDKGMTDFTIKGCYGYLMYRFMIACMWISGIVGYVLNFVVIELVVSMGVVVGNITGVTTTWMLLRDIANVFLVFLTIFVGISIIVDVGKFGSKQMLAKVLAAALFVNFSITLTKVIIDISNLATVQIYAMLLQNTGQSLRCARPIEGKLDTGDEKDCVGKGIATVFYDIARVTSVFDTAKSGNAGVELTEERAFEIGNISLVASVFFLVMAFIFGAGAAILVVRFVTLTFLIIVSPVAFVSYLTGVFGWGRKWWDALTSQALVAPVLMLMWYIVYKISQSMFALFGGGQNAVLANVNKVEDVNSVMIVFYIVLMTFFMVFSLSIAREIGSSVAGSAAALGKRWAKTSGLALTRTAGSLTVGTAAKLGRTLPGRWANNLANSKALAEAEAKGGMKGIAARQLQRAAAKTAGASFDARALSKTAQKYAGEAQGKGGYKQILDNKLKRHDEVLKRLGQGTPSNQQIADRDKEIREKREEAENLLRQEKERAYDDKKLLHSGKPGEVRHFYEGSTEWEIDERYKRAVKLEEDLQKKADAVRSKVNAAEPGSADAVLAQKELEAAEQELEKHQKDSAPLRELHEAIQKRNDAEIKIAANQNMTADELQAQRNIIAENTKIIKENYGAFNADIRAQDLVMAEKARDIATRESVAGKDDKEVAEMKRKYAALAQRRNNAVEMYEAADGVERMRNLMKDDGAGKVTVVKASAAQIKEAEDTLTVAKKNILTQLSNDREEVARKHTGEWKKEAEARQNAYIQTVEQSGRWKTFWTHTPTENRLAADRMRTTRGKSPEERAMEGFIKNWMQNNPTQSQQPAQPSTTPNQQTS